MEGRRSAQGDTNIRPCLCGLHLAPLLLEPWNSILPSCNNRPKPKPLAHSHSPHEAPLRLTRHRRWQRRWSKGAGGRDSTSAWL